MQGQWGRHLPKKSHDFCCAVISETCALGFCFAAPYQSSSRCSKSKQPALQTTHQHQHNSITMSSPQFSPSASNPVSHNTQPTLRLPTMEVNPFWLHLQVALQHCAPCYAPHAVFQLEAQAIKDTPCSFQCHRLKWRGWVKPKILHIERNYVYNPKGLVEDPAGSAAGCTASFNPPEVQRKYWSLYLQFKNSSSL